MSKTYPDNILVVVADGNQAMLLHESFRRRQPEAEEDR